MVAQAFRLCTRDSLGYVSTLCRFTEELLMYILAVKRDFVARHFLVGGDWGAENELHSHHYQVEVQLEGKILDEHGYLVDIVAVEAHLDELVAYYRDQTLNDLPEFAGLNPSIEHFARLLRRSS